MPQPDQAIERLYEDAELRGDLRDPEAEQLLRWATERVTELAASAPDEASFEEQFDTLRRMVRAINRLVGRRSDLDAEAREQRLAGILESAQALGLPLSVQASSAALEALPEQDDASSLQAVLSLVTPSEASDAAAFTAPPAPDSTPLPAEPEAPEPPARDVPPYWLPWLPDEGPCDDDETI